jgi:hypothetical protein
MIQIIADSTLLRYLIEIEVMADIEQLFRERKPFILPCMLDGIEKLQGRVVKWNRFALSVSIT